MVQYPPYEGIYIIGNRNNGVQFPPGFVLAFPFSLGYPVMERLIHVPLNKVQLLIREEVLQFANVKWGKPRNIATRAQQSRA